MRKYLMSAIVLASSTVLFAQPAPTTRPTSATAPAAISGDTVVIQVGDETITADQFEQFISALPEHVQDMARGPAKRMLADQLVQLKIMSQEARRRGLADDPSVKIQTQLALQQVLAQALAERVADEVDEAALKQDYEKNKAQFERVKARHILIRAEGSPAPAGEGKKTLSSDEAKKKAEELRKQIVSGQKDFAEIAKAESDDKGSGAQGGDLGYFGRGQMVGPFEEAAFSLKEGDVSEPIKTIFGYHLIQVQERKTQPFEEVKDQLASQQGPEKLQKLVETLKEQHKVTVNEAFFGPAMSRPTMPE